MLPRQKEKINYQIDLLLNVDTDQMDNEKNISSLVTGLFCFSSSLTFGAFFVYIIWSGAVCLKESSGYKCI